MSDSNDPRTDLTSRLSPGGPAGATPQGLADRCDLALIAVERTRMPMVASDPRQPDNPIVLVNPAFLKMTGYSSDEVVGRNCRFLQGPATDPATIDEVRRGLAANAEIQVELLNYRKDGTTFWNQLHVSPIFDPDGRLAYHFASQLDVTRQREAQALETAEYALLKEVDHRARNALALVQGIVRLSRAADPDAYARSVQGRVEALALAHGLLAEGRWRQVPLDALLRASAQIAGSTRVAIEGPPVALSPAQVQPLALVLHELLDNAQRHGALSAPQGVLGIRWRIDGNRLVLSIDEAGGPEPARRDAGIGMTMIDAVTRRQLRGDIAYDWRAGGLRSEVNLPLEGEA